MDRIVVYLGRLIVILAGFFCASLGASAFLHLIVLGGIPLREGELAFMAGGFLFSVPFVALFVGYFALIPAMVVIVAAEFLARRDWLFFALAGGGAGLAVAWLNGFDAREGWSIDPAAATVVFGAAGMIGGLCYWVVAGRGSGEWLDRAAGEDAPPPR